MFEGYERDEQSGACVDPRARGELSTPAPAPAPDYPQSPSQPGDIWGREETDQGYPRPSEDRYRPPASYNNDRYQETMKGYPRPIPDPLARDQETMKGYPRPGYLPDRYPDPMDEERYEEPSEERYHNPPAYNEAEWSTKQWSQIQMLLTPTL